MSLLYWGPKKNLWDIFLINDWCMKAQYMVGGNTPVQVVPDNIREQAE